MTQTLLRYAASIGIGLLLALPVVGALQLMNAQTAHAQGNALDTDSLLGGGFGDATGLGQSDLRTTIGNLINVVLGFLGVVAVCIVLLGGFKWMTAGGNDEKVAEAKRLLIAGVIGLAIILSAYAITSFVLSSIIQSSQTGSIL